MAISPRTATSWLLTARNVVVRNVARRGDDDVPPVLTYDITLNGDPYLSGTMVWEPTDVGVENAWATEITLPPTPGILKATVTATFDGLTGADSSSIKVIQ
jgi:hypothetical protein